jgi:hypothetical protein
MPEEEGDLDTVEYSKARSLGKEQGMRKVISGVESVGYTKIKHKEPSKLETAKRHLAGVAGAVGGAVRRAGSEAKPRLEGIRQRMKKGLKKTTSGRREASPFRSHPLFGGGSGQRKARGSAERPPWERGGNPFGGKRRASNPFRFNKKMFELPKRRR